VTVVIADDAEQVRQALSQLISADARFELRGVANDGIEAAELVERHLPDLAILDVKMGGGGGVRAARRIRIVSPGTRIVALSAFDSPSNQRRMREAGASAYLVKGAVGENLLDRLWELARGE
jgi:DNA-binding NarL/FixJ family response regulator